MRVVYAKTGENSLEDILEFLNYRWTDREIENFLTDIDILIENLASGNFQIYQKYSANIWSALIGKRHVRVYFRVESNDIIRLLYFFDMRDNPVKLNLFLK